MTAPALETLAALPGYRATGKGQWEARCPGHEDRKASLSIGLGNDGRILLHCHAGCDLARILEAARITERDLFENSGNGHHEPADRIPYWRKVWYETVALDSEAAEPGRLYLQNRGLCLLSFPSDVRFHRTLPYFTNQQTILGNHPAILCLVRNANREPIGAQRIYLTPEGRKADVPEPKKTIGPISGGAVYFSELGASLNVAEGPETGLAVWQATGMPTCAAVSATGMSRLEIHESIHMLDIWVDLDKSDAGAKAAGELGARAHKAGKTVFMRLPPGPIPEGRKGTDWLDILNCDGAEAFELAIERGEPWQAPAAEPEPQEPAEWPEPGELPQLLPEAPAMTADFLPDSLREYLSDISERKQIPLEIPAAAAIVALAAVLGLKIGILPKRRDDWLVVANLWGMIIARSGTMKTPAIAEALKPLSKLAADARAEFEKARAENSADIQVHEARIEAVRGEIRQAAKAKNDLRLEELSAALTELQNLADEKKATEKRIRVNDTTTEKLGELLRDNPNGLLLFRDELSGFLRALDRPGREGDREFYLESWDGTNSFIQDRIGRGTIYIPHNCLSILGGIQPGKLTHYIDDAVAGKTGDDGLLQRFQISVYPERRKTWRNVDEFPNHSARERAYRIFQNLYAMDPLTAGAKLPKYEKAPALHFDDEAQAVFDTWLEAHQARICADEIGSQEFESHLAKYRSLMPSLALIFHLVDWADSLIETAPLPALRPVSAKAARLAATWTAFLEAHARKVYAGLMQPDVQAAHALAQKIRAGKVKSGDQLRTIYRAHWSLLRSREAVMVAVQTLAEADWCRIETETTNGRPTDILRLNPHLERNK